MAPWVQPPPPVEPLAVGRVEVLPGDRVRLQLKRAWSDGATALELSTEELAERLVALVPLPRANQVLYGGCWMRICAPAICLVANWSA